MEILFNNSVKNELIITIFGMQKLAESWTSEYYIFYLRCKM